MTIRRRVQQWAEAKMVEIRGDLRASKFYAPEQSRSGRAAWWIEVPISALERASRFEVFCEKAVDVDEFHHLVIPAADLQAHRREFCVTNGKISVWLSAEAGDQFTDTHPKGKGFSFAPYLM